MYYRKYTVAWLLPFYSQLENEGLLELIVPLQNFQREVHSVSSP